MILVAGKRRQEEKRITEDEMVGRDHLLNRHELKQNLGNSEGQEAWSAAFHRFTKGGHGLATEQQQQALIIFSRIFRVFYVLVSCHLQTVGVLLLVF